MTHSDAPGVPAQRHNEAEAVKAVVRRNTEQVQGQGDFALFDELFASTVSAEHIRLPPSRQSRRSASIYPTARSVSRSSSPDPFGTRLHAPTTPPPSRSATHGTHLGDFLGIAQTGKTIHFETVDAMRVRNGKITDHTGA